MKYQNILKDVRPEDLNIFCEIGKHDCLTFDREGKRLGIRMDMPTDVKHTISDLAFKAMCHIRDSQEFLKTIEVTLLTRVLGKGPKIFRPTTEQCHAMDDVDLTLTVEDYHQPFESIVIELPEEYKKTKTLKDGDTPHIVSIHHCREKSIFVFAIISGTGMSRKSWWLPEPEQELEEFFVADISEWMKLANENQNYLDLIRMALNYALLIDEYGVKRVGPDNQDYYERLQRNAKKKTHHQARNLAELATVPIVYCIDQTPVLRKEVSSVTGDSADGHTGRVITPHHRRGHYRRQVFGAGRSQRKRVRIPPCFVNSHLYLGSMDKSITTYETK